MKTILSRELWPQLERLSAGCQVKRAAVAYVTSDQHIQFGTGDVLIVDASDSAIAGGQTDAMVIERAFERGAQLFSLAGLHTKVIVFDRTVSIGSANISALSRERLVEASLVADDSETTELAEAFLQDVLKRATLIDRAFIQRIKQIEVQPRFGTGYRGPKSYRRRHPHPILLYFQEILPGDVLKYRTQSADATTGGGARDLRISPAGVYRPILERMFPGQPDENGVVQGSISWSFPSGEGDSKIVELWRPTEARPNELRIGRFYEIGGWDIDEEQYNAERGEGFRWFYVLEMSQDGSVMARLLQQQHLDREDPLVAEHIQRQIQSTPDTHAARGAVDLATRTVVPAD